MGPAVQEADALVSVLIITHQGSEYIFPDIRRRDMDLLIGMSADVWVKSGHLALANVSQGTLVIPTRIVKQISYDGEVRWKNESVPAVSQLFTTK